MSVLTHKRHRRHANPFTLRGPICVPQWADIFGRKAPLAIDVGCGPGRFLVELARSFPHFNVLGLEIRQHLIDSALQMAKDMQMQHVYALLANANLHLPTLVSPKSVGFLSINFPDPWYKKRHHKRRVVSAQWLMDLQCVLQKDADIYAMSDYLPIAQQMRQVFQAHPGFENQHPGALWPSASLHNLTSEREQTHLKRGEPIYRMHFIYRGLD